MKFPDDQFTDPNLVTKDKRFMLPIGTSAKQALEMVYRGEIVLSPQQMRAAIECLQFEVPKVSAIAVSHMNGQDFASALETAIETQQTAAALTSAQGYRARTTSFGSGDEKTFHQTSEILNAR